MSLKYHLFRVAVAGCVLALPAASPMLLHAQTSGSPAADNSARNKAHDQEKTADQQAKGGAGDRDITKKIRRAIIADKSLSMYGHNVKIVTQDGAVTLKGPVHTDAEKQSIGAKAEEVAGQGKVTNELTVKQ
jgi:hyperosmotically inducible protein